MTSKHGLDGVSEAATYLLPKDSQSPRQSAVYRPSNKAQSAEEGREHVPSPRPAAAETPPPTLLEQGCAALFYAVASLLVIFVNKVRVRCGGSVLSRIDERTSEALTTFRCRVLHIPAVVGIAGLRSWSIPPFLTAVRTHFLL